MLEGGQKPVLTCQNPDIITNSLCCNVLLGTSFCFLHATQQKLVGMISIDNMLRAYSDQMYQPV